MTAMCPELRRVDDGTWGGDWRKHPVRMARIATYLVWRAYRAWLPWQRHELWLDGYDVPGEPAYRKEWQTWQTPAKTM